MALGRWRNAAFGALLAALLAYYGAAEALPARPTWWDVAWVGLVLMPAVFGLVLLVLPFRHERTLILAAASFAVAAVVFDRTGAQTSANFCKLAAVTCLAFWLLRWLESVSWIAVIALLVPLVDAYSVWRGPTHHILTKRQEIFTALSFAFPVPGEHASANLGLPDLLFFALFLGAAARFGLRVEWTWVLMTASFGTTIALAVAFGLNGLPALPGLSIGFLAPNADLLWARLRKPREAT